jgi:hypothetical protein
MGRNVAISFEPWIPWPVAGVGVGSLIGGFALHQVTRTDMESSDRLFAEQCANGCANGCAEPPPDAAALQQRSIVEDRVSIALIFGGGLAAIGGIAWAELFHRSTIEIVPTRGGASASAACRFYRSHL